MTDRSRVVSPEVVQAVEDYIDRELGEAEKYSNRSLLDEAGAWSLHELAAGIYGLGFDAGRRIESQRMYGERRREIAAVKRRYEDAPPPPQVDTTVIGPSHD